MNKIIDNFLFPGENFMSQLHLRQPGFTYSAYGPIGKHHKMIQKFREASHINHLQRYQLGKACFGYDAAHPDSKYLAKRTVSRKQSQEQTYIKSLPKNYTNQ